MQLVITPQLRAFLGAAELPEELKAQVDAALDNGRVEWPLLKAVARRLGDGAPSLLELCRGGGVALPAPKPRPAGKSPELEAHLAGLRRKLEQAQYDRMVADVTGAEREAAARAEGGLASYRSQVSFGVHVLAMMAAFYLFGHALGMALTSNKTLQPLVGLVFMVGAMVLETVLFIIRTSVPPKLHVAATQRAQRARAEQRVQQQRQEADSSVREDDALEPGAAGRPAAKLASEKKDD